MREALYRDQCSRILRAEIATRFTPGYLFAAAGREPLTVRLRTSQMLLAICCTDAYLSEIDERQYAVQIVNGGDLKRTCIRGVKTDQKA